MRLDLYDRRQRVGPIKKAQAGIRKTTHHSNIGSLGSLPKGIPGPLKFIIAIGHTQTPKI